jgi:CheY-like chemotaxis protein
MKKVLVVDDETEIVELIWMILAGSGLDILTAHNGLEALEIVRQERPQLVLADIMMPRMSGLELATQLQENPETCDTVILLMSAARHVDLNASGARGLIRKPFDIRSLIDTVHRHLEIAA